MPQPYEPTVEPPFMVIINPDAHGPAANATMTSHKDYDSALKSYQNQSGETSAPGIVVLMFAHDELDGRSTESPQYSHLFSPTRH